MKSIPILPDLTPPLVLNTNDTVPVPEILYVECCNVEEEDRVAVAAAVVALGSPLLRYDLTQPQHEISYEVASVSTVALGRHLLRYDLAQPQHEICYEVVNAVVALGSPLLRYDLT